MSWHDGEPVTVVAGLFVAVIFLVFNYGAISTTSNFSTLRSSEGIPLARDFANSWAASKLALAGKGPLAYNFNDLMEVQKEYLGSTHYFGSGWFYPPTFLLMVLPLGLLPYLTSVIVWLSVTLVLFGVVISRTSAHPIVVPLAICSPAVYQNIITGQNGFLSAALLGGGLLLLERWPFLSGCLLGALSFKPPLMALTFLVLVCARHWKALAGVAVSSILLALASTMVFGFKIWPAYFAVMSTPMKYLELGQAPWFITPTAFSAILSAGLEPRTAYLVQGLVMLVVLAGVVWVWRKKTDVRIYGSVLVLGTLLFSPYGFLYELVMLALPLAWLWEEGRLYGRFPGELLLLFIGWLTPLISPLVWNWVHLLQGRLQIGPVILLALFFYSLARAKVALNRENDAL